MAGNRQGHHRHIRLAAGARKRRIGPGHGGDLRGIGLDAAQKFGPTAHLGQLTALEQLDGTPIALAHHLPRQQTAAIEIRPEGKGLATGGRVEGRSLTRIQQGDSHLHKRLQQLSGVIRHGCDKQGVATGAAFHRLRIGRHLRPGARWSLVTGPAQQIAISERDPCREIPGNGELSSAPIGACAAARLPNQGQVVVCGALRQQRLQGLQASLTGEIGRKQGIEVDHIRSRAGKHRRQQLALHRPPGHIGPDHVVTGVLAFPIGNDSVEVVVEFGGEIQRPELNLARPGAGALIRAAAHHAHANQRRRQDRFQPFHQEI